MNERKTPIGYAITLFSLKFRSLPLKARIIAIERLTSPTIVELFLNVDKEVR